MVFASFKGNACPVRHHATFACCPRADARSGGRWRPKPKRRDPAAALL